MADFHAAPISAGRYPLCVNPAELLGREMVQHLACTEPAAHFAAEKRVDKNGLHLAEESICVQG